jgi:hypothetical protein
MCRWSPRVAKESTPYTERITLTVSKALKSELEVEAWESRRSLANYIRGLLERRGKWARSVGGAGGYDIQAPETARRVK